MDAKNPATKYLSCSSVEKGTQNFGSPSVLNEIAASPDFKRQTEMVRVSRWVH
jgi:hypothetical protein